MVSYPIDIRRCRHIRTNGTQCGSPALKGKELCFYHEQNQPREVELYIDGERYSDGSIMIPPFEDAHSIQMVLRHIVQLMLQRRIDRKDAGLALYALQIASGNLKTMQAEKAKPTQVVVEPDKAAETPLGMTPWSATGEGHDPDEDEGEEAYEEEEEAQPEAQSSPAPPPTADELYDSLTVDERTMIRTKWHDEGMMDLSEYEDYLEHDALDPLLLTIRRLCAERDQRAAAESQNSETPADRPLPPGTRQACQTRSATMGSR